MALTSSPLTPAQQLVKLLISAEHRSRLGSYDFFHRFLQVLEAALRRAPDSEWEPLIEPVRDCIPDFQRALALLAEAALDSFEDVLGPAYMLYGRNRKGFAQFFTPWNVAQMMAQMTAFGHDLRDRRPVRPITVLDPSCGSGVMLLAAASQAPEAWARMGRILFFGVDLDPTCCLMARLNLKLHGMHGNIFCGNGLTATAADIYGPWASLVSRFVDAETNAEPPAEQAG